MPLLPIIRPTIDDYAGTFGLRGALEDWAWDLSTTYGRNTVGYGVENTLIDATPSSVDTRYDAGSVRYAQSTTNLELTRALSYFDETRLALGAELRTESYGITPGTAPGVFIQGFPAFTSIQSTSQSRHDIGAYVDLESDLSTNVTLALAGRGEHYSDVGTVGAGKLALRWEPVRKYALRASAERGFRAPSLAQSYYSNVGIDPSLVSFVSSVPLAGAPALSPERTMTYSAGMAVEPTNALSVSADVYRVEVKDRIVLLDDPFKSYSVNGADTRTNGLDVTANYAMRLQSAGTLRVTGGLDLNSTTVTRNAFGGTSALSVVSTTRIERGQPRNTLFASGAYQLGDFGALLRTQHFGEVVVSHGGTQNQQFGARWITDANVSYTLLRKYTFTAGADNLFDVYPDSDPFNVPLVGGFSTHSPYSTISPFGVGGRFIFARLSIYL